MMLAAALLTTSLLFNPGPSTDCSKWPQWGPCTYIEWAGPQWFRIFRGAEGYNQGITSVGIRGRGQADPCKLREATTVHYHFPGVSFKRAYQFKEFRKILWRFEAKLDYYAGPPECPTLPTAYVTADTAVSWPDGSWVLLGMLIYLGPDAWRPASQPFWGDGVNRTLILTPYQLRGGEWQECVFDLKALYPKYHLPPKGYTWDEAIVGMAEVYVSVRGADLEYSSRNHDVVGVE